LLVLEGDPSRHPGFYEALGRCGTVLTFESPDAIWEICHGVDEPVILLDTEALKSCSNSDISSLVELRGRIPIGLITHQPTEDYLVDLRRWGLLQSFVKNDPIVPEELAHFIACVAEPLSGFGLHGYLHHTMELYNVSAATIPEKNNAIEAVINHFATSGFEVHELYDVRLILEEALNNAFFHAFRTPTGEEKYNLHNITRLDPKEKVRLEYGNGAHLAGFSVTDSAGTLRVHTVLNKLERQLNKEGLYDCSGRGLYLSRMLSTAFILNVEEGKRTQVIALFDKRRHMDRPKPFMVNFLGRDTFNEWRLDPDFD
jgi:hypothetical protein